MSLTRWLSDDTLAIFLFHGVIREQTHPVRNYTGKHILEADFIEHLKVLSTGGVPLSMDDVLLYCQEGEPFPPKAFAVTFDDGFENNFSVAAPALADFSIPATFYLTTSFVDENAMSWIDRVEYCLEEARDANVHLPWRDEPDVISSTKEAIRMLDDIRKQVKASPDMDIEQFVQSLFDQCKVTRVNESDDPVDLKMNWEQVAALHSDPAFIVGGHTHTHAILGFLSESEVRQEVELSLNLLERNAGVGPEHFSYPEGQANHFNQGVIETLQEYGVRCCPTAMEGVNYERINPFHLKRVMVG